MIRKKRLFYAALTALLLCVEVLIALFVRDDFVRPYVGDVLVVMLLYCLTRWIKPEGIPLLPLYVFLLAVAVELAQLVDILSLLGLADSTFLRIVVGGTFSWPDILCYAIGCAMCAGIQHWFKRR